MTKPWHERRLTVPLACVLGLGLTVLFYRLGWTYLSGLPMGAAIYVVGYVDGRKDAVVRARRQEAARFVRMARGGVVCASSDRLDLAVIMDRGAGRKSPTPHGL